MRPHVELADTVEPPVAVRIRCEGAGEVVAEHPLQQPYPDGVHLLVVVGRRARHDAVEVRRVALRLHQPLPAAGGAPLEVGVRGLVAVVVADHRLRRRHRQVHGPIPEVDLGLPVVVGERRAGLGTVVVPRVAVGHRVAFRNAVIGEVEIAVLAAVAPLEEATVPVARQRQLHVEVDRRRQDPLDVAVGGSAGGFGQACVRERQVAEMQQRFAAGPVGAGSGRRALGRDGGAGRKGGGHERRERNVGRQSHKGLPAARVGFGVDRQRGSLSHHR